MTGSGTDAATLDRLVAEAAASLRGRSHLSLHSPVDVTHRILIGLQPDTYVRPHYHPPVPHGPRDEFLVVLRGSIGILLFDVTGQLKFATTVTLGATWNIPAPIVHTVVSTSPDTVILEVRLAASSGVPDKEFAAGFPPEASPECAELLGVWISVLQQSSDLAR